jgi:uncharacterized membrane protein YphA (DoxX/SURF4 family)
MNLQFDPIFQYSVCLCYAMLFGLAAVHKFQYQDQFRQTLNKYRVIPDSVNGLIAITIPFIEVAIALALAIPELRATAALAASLLLSGYALVMASTIIRKINDIDCGCNFGNQKQVISWGLVLRNLVLSLIPLTLLFEQQKRELYWIDWLLIIFVMTAFSLVYLIVNTLLEQQRKLEGLLP